MKKPVQNTEKLLDQSHALTNYLDALLSEVDWDSEDVAVDSMTTGQSNEQVNFDSPPAVIESNPFETPTESLNNVSVEPEPKKPIDQNDQVFIKENSEGAQQEYIEEQDSKVLSIPPWAEGDFQCLRFRIGDMEFTAPLDKLNGIIEWPDNITSLPGGAPWFVGLVRNRGQNVQIVDIQNLILKNEVDINKQSTYQGRFIMLIDEGRWGLICDEVSTVLSITAENVKWQTQANVPFIVGTVIEQMCSLMDVDALTAQLCGGNG